jgi:hypothetical protein
MLFDGHDWFVGEVAYRTQRCSRLRWNCAVVGSLVNRLTLGSSRIQDKTDHFVNFPVKFGVVRVFRGLRVAQLYAVKNGSGNLFGQVLLAHILTSNTISLAPGFSPEEGVCAGRTAVLTALVFLIGCP